MSFRDEEQRRFRRATSLARVSLFSPWIPINVIAVGFPKPGLILAHQCHAPHPLGAFPEIKMWNQQARGSAVLRCKILALKSKRHPRLVVLEILQRHVSAVPAVRMNHGVSSIAT